MRIRLAIAALAIGISSGLVGAADQREAPVGMTARIDALVLPGPELEAKPNPDRMAPLVLRIASVYPHGTAFRYDLVYYGLEAGKFDLKDYLQRKDRSSMADVPALPVAIRSTLPAGHILPNALEVQASPWLGGYRLALIVGGVLWMLGLLGILLVGRRKKAVQLAAARPATLADHLRPLVEQAITGTLSATERADLERTLLAYWRRRLSLGDMKPIEAFALLREHADAGPLLRQLEAWLHRPPSEVTPAIDVAALLRPYHEALSAPSP